MAVSSVHCPSSGFSALRTRRLFVPDNYVPKTASSTSRVRRAYRGNSSLLYRGGLSVPSWTVYVVVPKGEPGDPVLCQNSALLK